MDEILECQRSPCDKSGLGHNKEDEKYKVGTWTSRKHEPSSSFSKDGSEAARHEHVQSKETIRRTEQAGHQGVGPIPQDKFRRETPSRLIQKPKYENVFNGYCFSCNQFGHKALDCKHYARRSVGNQIPEPEGVALAEDSGSDGDKRHQCQRDLSR